MACLEAFYADEDVPERTEMPVVAAAASRVRPLLR